MDNKSGKDGSGKKRKIVALVLYWGLTLLPMLVTLFLLPYLPEQVPVHFDIYWNVDRWGSKYETLLFPGVLLLIGCASPKIYDWKARRSEEAKGTEPRVSLLFVVCTLAMLNVIGFYILYRAYYVAQNLPLPLALDGGRLIFLTIGLCFIIFGNLMPKFRKNGFVGLRTPWSMYNDEAWFKSQRRGGAIMCVYGLALVPVNLFVEGFSALIVSFSLSGVMLAACILVSYLSYRKAKNNSF